MIYTDNKGRTLDVTVWDGSDVTEDVLGAPARARTSTCWSRRRKTTPTAAAASTSRRPR